MLIDLSEKFKNIPEEDPKREEVKEELEVDKEVKKTKKNIIIKAINYLNDRYGFRYNEITSETEVKIKGKWYIFDDKKYNEIRLQLELSNISISDNTFNNIVFGETLAKTYNPLKDYLSGLPKVTADVDYIQRLCEHLHLSDESKRPYVNKAFKKWFVSMVGSIIDPGKANHLCVVLVGGQNTGKTTFLNNLIPQHLKKDYLYSNTFLPHDKDHRLFLATKWMINLDEMEVFNRVDVRTIKSVMTVDKVVLRKAYARESLTAPRIASFCGSVNNPEFLSDETGTRRWIPIQVESVDFEIDRSLLDNCYSQAVELYKDKKFIHFIELSDLKELEDYNKEFNLMTMEEEMVLKHFRKPTEKEIELNKLEYLLPNEIVSRLCKLYDKLNHNNTVKNNIGKALKKYGFSKVSKRIKGYEYPQYLWLVVQESNEVVNLSGEPIHSPPLF